MLDIRGRLDPTAESVRSPTTLRMDDRPMLRLIALLLFSCFILLPVAEADPLRTHDDTEARPSDSLSQEEDQSASSSWFRYPAASQGQHAEAAVLIALPPGYQDVSSRRFPVLYWLGQDAPAAMRRMTAAMRAGDMPPVILAMPRLEPAASAEQTAQTIAQDLLPWVDRHFRTLTTAGHRAVEGVAEGGLPALSLAVRQPELFGALSAIAPRLPSAGESAALWQQIDHQADALWRAESHIRLVADAGNPSEARAVAVLADHLQAQGIANQAQALNLGAVGFERALESMGADYFGFWREALRV